ncbi:MAG: glycosyltransferase [Chromatiaceae bacterium]|nr:glycosyltransferase [Chromatiaceae bacterium]
MTSTLPTLSISIVTFRPTLDVLQQTLDSLIASIQAAQAMGSLGATTLALIDNGTQQPRELQALAIEYSAHLIRGQGNIGYGRGHNLSLLTSSSHFHLVLNPDVILDRHAIDAALRYMSAHTETIMLAPKVGGPNRQGYHLCKRYPSMLALALRGLGPPWLRRRFAQQLDHYELAELPLDRPQQGVPLLSGSFMFCRRAPLVAIGGFSSAFFVYFEDFDLSLRAAEVGQLAYVPQVEVIHFGGNAARKGWRHRLLFIRGAYTFFQRHGWKWY